MNPTELEFSTEINIVTSTMLLHGDVVNKVSYFCSYSKKRTVLYVTDNVTQTPPIQTIKKLLSAYSVIVVTPDISTPICHPNLVYIQVPERLYNEETLVSLKNIFGLGSWGKTAYDIICLLAQHFNIRKFETLDAIMFKNETDILIQDFDGLGDVLMLTPIVRSYADKGFNVTVVTRFPEVFYNSPYVAEVLDSNDVKPHPDRFGRYYDITFQLSAYEKKFCRQHRIEATAHLCGLTSDELTIQRPEIFLSDEEKDSFKGPLSTKHSLCVSLTSADKRRGYETSKFIPLLWELQRQLPNWNIVIVGERERNMVSLPSSFMDLRGCTTIRELFSVIYNSDSVLCVDSSVLHIAGAFKKPTVLLPSTIPGEWRMYPETVQIKPPVRCYPCYDRKPDCPNNVVGGWCMGQIPLKEIVLKVREL